MAALAMENSWDLDLSIDIPSNYWIKNEDIDAELSGQLNLVREKTLNNSLKNGRASSDFNQQAHRRIGDCKVCH
jgi:hypothetical protein